MFKYLITILSAQPFAFLYISEIIRYQKNIYLSFSVKGEAKKTTMKQFFRAFLYGMAFVLPGMILFSNQKINRFSAILPYFSDLPILTDLSKDFKTGLEIAGEDFKKFQANYNKYNKKTPVFINKNQIWSWNRIEIAQKLQEKLGKRQIKRQQLFLNYIEKYAPYALSEMAQSRIPASVTMAQGILETRAGDSYIARAANNHFGIKCYRKPGFKTDGYISDDDFYTHSLAYDCIQIADDNVWDRFQMYENPALSFRHHTLLLTKEARYNWMISQYGDKVGENCFVETKWFGTAEVPYYAAWCIGLKKSGYATSKTYAQKLTYIIETYELWRLDYQLLANLTQ